MSLLYRYEQPRFCSVRRLIEWGLLAATVLLRVVGLVRSMSTLITMLVQPDVAVDVGSSQRPDWSQAADAWYTSAFIETDEERSRRYE